MLSIIEEWVRKYIELLLVVSPCDLCPENSPLYSTTAHCILEIKPDGAARIRVILLS